MTDRSKPSFRIEIGGAIQRELAGYVQRLEVEDSIQAPSMFSFDVAETREKKWLDEGLLDPGKKDVKIYLGYVDELELMISGLVNSLDYSMRSNGQLQLTVQGFDYSTKLQKSYKNDGAGFNKQKISEIIQGIASVHSLECKCDPTEILYESMKMGLNESDYDFAMRMAGSIGYEFYIRDKTLYFHKPNYKNPTKTLSWMRCGGSNIDGLSEVGFRLTMANAVEEIEARGYDPKENRQLVSNMRPAYISSIRPAGKRKAINIVHTNQKELELIAQSLADEASRTVEISATMMGDPSLKSGNAIKVAEISKVFDGCYYITRARHTIGDNGYTTTLNMNGPIIE